MDVVGNSRESASSRKLKACTNCTNAKTKCTPYGNLNNLCERCHRLGKPCTYAEATVRPKKNRLSSRKQLEEKVDSLVNLLSTIQRNDPDAASRIPQSMTIHNRSPHDHRASLSDTSPHGDSGLGTESPMSPEAEDDEMPDVLDNLDIETANQLFSQYCREYVQEFPFVTFAPSETVSTMQINRPLTLKSLLAITLGKEMNMQRKAINEISGLIKKAMLHRSGYSFDLLQAVLIQCGYYHYQFRSQKQELLLFISYAITLSHELGIDKSPSARRVDMTAHGLATAAMEGVRFEQWRALLGVYYEASIFSQAFRKPRLMQWTRYMDQCRKRLSQGVEMQTDYTIDVMISMQNVCLDALDTFTLYDFENVEVSGDLAIKSLVHGFMERLRFIEEKAKLQRGGNLLANEHRLLLYAQSYVHEVAIHKDFWPTNPDSPIISITRAQLGWDGLERAKTLAKYYTALPSSDWLRLDTGPITQMLYSLIMLNKYVSLDSSDASPSASNQWDIQLAFKEAEVQKLGVLIIEKMAELVTVEKLFDESRPIWWALGWIVKNMVHGHQARICGGLFGEPRPRKEDPLVESQAERQAREAAGSAQGSQQATPATMTAPTEGVVPAGGGAGMDRVVAGVSYNGPELPDGVTRGGDAPFAMSFPDINFGDVAGGMMWQDTGGMYNSQVWDVMLNDMTTLPFG